MYLKGSSYNYSSKRKRSSPIRILILMVLVGVGLYYAINIVPQTDPLFIPTSTPTTAPEAYLNQAEQLYSEGRITRAIEMYQQAINSDPKNINTYIALAKLQVFNGQYSEALTNAENAILLNPNNAEAHAVRGWAIGMQGNYLDAQTAFNRAKELNPNLALAYAYQTEVLVEQINNGEDRLDTLTQATENSRQAINLGNTLMETHRARGLLLEITGNYEEAVTEFQIAIAINPNIADLYLALGRAYRANGMDTEAITAFERASTLNPYDPWAPYYISRTYASNGEYTKAIQQGEDAIELDPTQTQFYWNLGTQYYRSGDYAKALDYFRIAIQGGIGQDGAIVRGIPLSYDNRVSELYYMYGLILARSGQCQEAAEVVRLLTQGVPDDATAILNAEYMTEVCKNGDFDIVLISSPTEEPSTDETENAEELLLENNYSGE
ncbi:MAG: tetratricopeptide repeat protein [Anaerolineaceae bacterium]|nr:tetratricopeptide repeat protein [Anaerolineaceae bacterium]